MHAPKYNLAFTAASLRPEQARIMAESYLSLGDWSAVTKQVLGSNALQARAGGSSARLERELRQRLQNLTLPQLHLLANAPSDDRAAMSWLAACKQIQFVREFATEALREKLASHDPILRFSDYESYVDAKAVAHPELSSITPKTRAKLRQVLFRMLTEAGLLVAGPDLGTIQRPVLSPGLRETIASDDARWLSVFLVPDIEISTP